MNDTLERFAAQKLADLERAELRRSLQPTTRSSRARTERNAKALISFACNDYLGLSQHPEVVAASCAATQKYGTGAGASRHVSGNHPLYAALEERLAKLKGSEDAVVFGSGYLVNIGVIPALVGPEDLVLIDELSHACLFAGARLARATVLEFAHNDVADAARLLAEHRGRHRHVLVLTEGVFSMDGDRAPLADLLDLTQRHDAWLMTDDAHGLGVVGGGRGSAVVGAEPLPIPLQMGTLSKAVGAYGGYLCASRTVAELIRNRARSLIYTTGLPPGVLAAAHKALEIIATDHALVARPLENARLFAALRGMPGPASAIVPIVLGTPARALEASRALEARGFLVVAIRPPTVPEGTARLRLAFSAAHSGADIERLATAIDSVPQP
ncbi:MAG TPA: 8-amino-7-oxononanoate synthase [Gammaproteobacteria bacterium]|nr:8-amino-7-oxononanoate synthase [Gammaproteobacteria bacterium]